MTLWYRIFGSGDTPPEPAAVLEHVNGLGVIVTGRFDGDAAGWLRAELLCADTPILLERFLASEEGIRAELNSWAAWLEARPAGPAPVRLMERVIQTQQLITVELPSPTASVGPVCVGLCRFLATATAGVYQADGQGFFDTEGNLLMREE